MKKYEIRKFFIVIVLYCTREDTNVQDVEINIYHKDNMDIVLLAFVTIININ